MILESINLFKKYKKYHKIKIINFSEKIKYLYFLKDIILIL